MKYDDIKALEKTGMPPNLRLVAHKTCSYCMEFTLHENKCIRYGFEFKTRAGHTMHGHPYLNVCDSFVSEEEFNTPTSDDGE